MDPRDGTMRYRAIAETIREEIATGEYGPGDALPSQSVLAERFETTVTTVRQALRLLQEEGLLESLHGVGSFVSGLTDEHRALQLSSFSGALEASGIPVETRVIALRPKLTDPSVARWFATGEGQFALLERLRFVRGRPVIYQRSYVPERYASVLENYTPEKGLYGELSRSLRRVIAVAEEELEAVGLPEEVARLLKAEAGDPAFLSRRISKTLPGESVLFDLAYMVGASVRVELYRRGRFSRFSYAVNGDGGTDG
ncbi:MAG: GntR family transcriptional regulator [Spirochaetaceae bacterium]